MNSSPLTLDPRTYARGLACIHCGLCLPACPTYTQNFNEADSPRGRIQLMLGLSDGTIQPTDSVVKHLDLCLDCRGCETICPSGVVYHELIEETRVNLAKNSKPTLQGRVLRWMFFHIFTKPTRLKLALLPARLLQKIGLLNLFGKLGQMLPPTGSWWPKTLPQHSNPSAEKKIAYFPGCVGSVIYDEVNRKAVDLITACKVDAVVSEKQVCCGAIHLHNGDAKTAMQFARQNIDAMNDDSQLITTTIAGCGAMLREYGHLLRDDPAYKERAEKFSQKVCDISEVLLALDLPPIKNAVNETVTYHDACHLIHAQKVSQAPRALLAKIPGLKMVPLPESDICCGAAGTYNLTQPDMAGQLAERKLNNIDSTGCKICVTGNVGCAMQIASQARLRGENLVLVHPVELLYRAIIK